MKYILATDSFKGSLSSMEVEAEIAEVLTEKGADVVSLPAATACWRLSRRLWAEP